MAYQSNVFNIFKLVYFTTVTVNWVIYISNINVFSQLNDLVYMSCGKQMKLIISIEFHLPFFSQFKFVFACHF